MVGVHTPGPSDLALERGQALKSKSTGGVTVSGAMCVCARMWLLHINENTQRYRGLWLVNRNK